MPRLSRVRALRRKRDELADLARLDVAGSDVRDEARHRAAELHVRHGKPLRIVEVAHQVMRGRVGGRVEPVRVGPVHGAPERDHLARSAAVLQPERRVAVLFIGAAHAVQRRLLDGAAVVPGFVESLLEGFGGIGDEPRRQLICTQLVCTGIARAQNRVGRRHGSRDGRGKGRHHKRDTQNTHSPSPL